MSDRPATLRDVAAAARVHPATASRALNPGTRLLVSEETARRVTEAAERLGYRPNPVARSLRTRRSHTVGVLIPDLNNPLFPPIVRGLEDRLAEHGYVALIGNTDGDAARERMVFDQMRARHVDGFVLATATLHSDILNEATEADLPALVAIYNEVMQFFLIVAGFIPLVFLGLRDVGGWSGLKARLGEVATAQHYAPGAFSHSPRQDHCR